MAQSLDALVEKEEKTSERPSWLRNTGLALAGAGLLAMLSPSFSNADSTTIRRDNHGNEIGYERTINVGQGNDSVTIYYDKNGREIGHQRHIDTSRDTVDPNPLGHPQAKFFGRNEIDLIREGKEAYHNGAMKHADDTFTYLNEVFPGNIEAHIYGIKTYYNRFVSDYGPEQTRKYAAQSAKGRHEKMIRNDALLALAERFEKDQHPLEFSLSAFQDYKKGMEAYKKEDYSTASKMLRKSVKEDPWNEDAYEILSSSEKRRTGNNGNTCNIWKEAVKYHPRFQSSINKFCK